MTVTLILGLCARTAAFPRVLGEATTPKFSKPYEVHAVRITLKKNRRYYIEVIPQDTLDVRVYLIDRHGVIYDSDEDSIGGLLFFLDLGTRRNLQITTDKADYFYVVVVDCIGNGTAKVQVVGQFNIV